VTEYIIQLNKIKHLKQSSDIVKMFLNEKDGIRHYCNDCKDLIYTIEIVANKIENDPQNKEYMKELRHAIKLFDKCAVEMKYSVLKMQHTIEKENESG